MIDRLIPSVHHANRPLPLNGHDDLVACLETLKKVGWLSVTSISLLKIPIYSVFREQKLNLDEHAESHSIANICRNTKGLELLHFSVQNHPRNHKDSEGVLHTDPHILNTLSDICSSSLTRGGGEGDS